ncbi:hypothetical protein M9Y10_034216 [Tritrichomonas musculus]|uniref:Actin-like protein ARP6 n=1 Tax=Tritrichomonas musculus TaxID=1915356 RepID=A0ABR2KEA6_9EUKA
MDQSSSSIILDPGSGSIKFGVSYFDKTCDQKIYQNMSIPSLYGTSRYPSALFRKKAKKQGNYRHDYVIGKHVIMLFDLLDVTFPVHRGVVTDWDIVMTIVHDGLQSLQSNSVPIPNSILVSEPWFHPRKKREKMVEIIFEKFEYEYFFSVPQAALTLYNYNQSSGYVIESGAEQTQFVPIFNSHKVQHGCLNFNQGGFDVTIQIPKAQVDINNFQLNKIEEALFKDEKKMNPYPHFYEIENLKRNPPENLDINGIYNSVFFSENNLNHDNDLFYQIKEQLKNINTNGSNSSSVNPLCSIPNEIYFGGGNFACKYFRETIEAQFKSEKIRSHTLPDDDFEWSVWKGGNKFVNLPTMKDFWISIEDYYENGTNVINFSCL